MIDEQTVPLLGTLETNPDAIPRGFIHRDPDILNIHQQNALSDAKVKMMDFNHEYLAKHPQVEALVRLLIKELIIHKPYYVREFIKQTLSRDDLETQVAKMVVAKELSVDRRHTRHYFSHIKTWQDKASGVDEPEAQKEEGDWPEPRPFRVETRRDKREYTHPHYFKVPYVFFPAEYLTPKMPTFKRRKYPRFRSKSYAKMLLQKYKDFWGCPATDIPPPMNEEELYSAWSVLKNKPEEEMTNDELIKCCLWCRRTRMRNYIYAMNKKEFNSPTKAYPSYTILKKSFKSRVANAFLEKTLEVIRRKEVKIINCAFVPNRGRRSRAEQELIKFKSRFAPHHPIAEMNKYKSPVPGIRFKEKGAFRMRVPLADLRKKVNGKIEINPRISISENKDEKKCFKITVPTTDLQGNIIEESEIAVTLGTKEAAHEDSYTRPGDHEIGNTLDKLDENHPKETRATEAVAKEEVSSGIMLTERKPSTRMTGKKKVMIRDTYGIAGDSYVSFKGSDVIVDNEEQTPSEDTIAEETSSTETIQNYSDKKSPSPLPSDLEDPYMQMLMDCKRVRKHFKKRKEDKTNYKRKRKLKIPDLKRYL